MKRNADPKGFTLVEMLISAAIGAIILLVVVMIGKSSNDAYLTVQEDTDANFSLRQALHRISDDLRQSNSSVIVITPGTDYDSVDLQTPISYASSTVSWGAAGTAGWHVRILVDNNYGWLVRRVTDSVGTPKVVDEVLARNVDVAYQGVKGFSVSTDNSGLYQVSLRVLAQSGQTVWRRTETTSVSVRN